jgi:hypothetical protein
VLTPSISLKRFQPIARGYPKIIEFFCQIELLELPEGYFLNIGWEVGRLFTFVDFCGSFTAEGENHLGP